jgi:alginate O-acetyltransferase complex protein AlgJ
LRPVLTAVRSDAEAYLLYDAHWTPRGALAGFNAVVDADSHPDWRLDALTAIGPSKQRKGGDVSILLGVQDAVSESSETFALSLPGTDEVHTEGSGFAAYRIVTTGRSGPTIMVIGDSFTAEYFTLMLAQHVGRAIWVHHRQCGFDWKLIDKFHPDEVWWTPTERFLLCDLGVHPIDFPRSAQ